MHTVIQTSNGWAVMFVGPNDGHGWRRPLECFSDKLEAYEFCAWLNGGPTPRESAIDDLQYSEKPKGLTVNLDHMNGWE